jgi:hypothetical protein
VVANVKIYGRIKGKKDGWFLDRLSKVCDVNQILAAPAEYTEVPVETGLRNNYPNPFNPETWIPFELARDAAVKIEIYDVTGRLVRTLDMGNRSAGHYLDRSKAAYWDGRNELGESVASGIYFYKFTAGDFSAIRRMTILK